MEYDKFNEPMERLARWVLEILVLDLEEKECPKVGYLGYANGMSNAEWLAVSLAQELLFRQGKDWKDYFDYRVDSSG